MNQVARMSAGQRAEVFAETADRKDLPEAIVEKDFWVCWVLQQLFSIETLSGRILFKGGTSLSKIFHAINRFSEDIDLAVDYAALGFTGEKDPRVAAISKSRRNRILAEMMASCRRYIGDEFLQTFRTRCRQALGASGDWSVSLSADDPNVVRFAYPPAARGSLAYVVPQVVLELGTHAEFIPRGRFTIRSFVAEEFPGLMEEGEVGVIALLAKRTFWEKATILHAEFHRPPERPLPDRYSRHYYDVAMLGQGGVRAEALADWELLERVVRHKETFYPSAWARYDRARPGSFHLLPPEIRMAALQRDYRNMAVMIFGRPPAFETIMQTLAAVEREINAGGAGSI
ncbi:MAG TPA: nucleotidyl transferase AbiEii/AbiGii toxin family protein [Bryobacteraceae bacterium]|nr:nucleotidyl transferase AbiEii/AbiGii toxin family protein [Bryobacteraceae bacterium]